MIDLPAEASSKVQVKLRAPHQALWADAKVRKREPTRRKLIAVRDDASLHAVLRERPAIEDLRFQPPSVAVAPPRVRPRGWATFLTGPNHER